MCLDVLGGRPDEVVGTVLERTPADRPTLQTDGLQQSTTTDHGEYMHPHLILPIYL